MKKRTDKTFVERAREILVQHAESGAPVRMDTVDDGERTYLHAVIQWVDEKHFCYRQVRHGALHGIYFSEIGPELNLTYGSGILLANTDYVETWQRTIGAGDLRSLKGVLKAAKRLGCVVTIVLERSTTRLFGMVRRVEGTLIHFDVIDGVGKVEASLVIAIRDIETLALASDDGAFLDQLVARRQR